MPMAATPPSARYHLAPPHGWLNDPNGLVRHEGRWHVFYQHNPHAAVHDHIGWGHASSTDLVTWRHHPIAFGPSAGGPDAFGCWSGTFMPGLDRPAVVYSGITDESLGSTVCLRWGSDDLDTWGEPVVVAGTPEVDGIRVMRDPFVFSWSGTRYAVLGAGLDDGTPAVLLFSCEDPLAWCYRGVWLTDRSRGLEGTPVADIWECPQVLELDGGVVVVLSLQLDGVLGEVLAVVGEMAEVDGQPEFTASSSHRLDLGTSFYAPQALAGGPEPLVLGWVRQEDVDPAVHDVAGCLTLPRRLSLRDGVVHTSLDPAVETLVGEGEDRGAGRHRLPTRCVVVIHGDGEGSAAVEPGPPALAGLRRGTRVWVDADVVEAHPDDGSPPTTVRGASSAWWLVLPDGGRATVHDIGLPARG